MSKKANVFLIGTFVIIGIVMFILSILVFSKTDFFSKKVTFCSTFNTPLDGLNVGSPVKFKGVSIGIVKKIEIVFDDVSNEAVTLVEFDINPDLFRSYKDKKLHFDDYDAFYREQIGRGLAAKLSMESILTRKLYIGLDYFPMKNRTLIARSLTVNKCTQMPTVPTEFEELKNSINTIANKLARIDIEGIMGKVSDLIDSTNKKVDSIDFEMVNYAMASITDVLSFDSSTRQSLDKFLQQGSKMMRSLRVFLDYLERNPNAMIAGKAL